MCSYPWALKPITRFNHGCHPSEWSSSSTGWMCRAWLCCHWVNIIPAFISLGLGCYCLPAKHVPRDIPIHKQRTHLRVTLVFDHLRVMRMYHQFFRALDATHALFKHHCRLFKLTILHMVKHHSCGSVAIFDVWTPTTFGSSSQGWPHRFQFLYHLFFHLYRGLSAVKHLVHSMISLLGVNHFCYIALKSLCFLHKGLSRLDVV